MHEHEFLSENMGSKVALWHKQFTTAATREQTSPVCPWCAFGTWELGHLTALPCNILTLSEQTG